MRREVAAVVEGMAGRIRRRHSGMDFQMKQGERDDIMAKSASGVVRAGRGWGDTEKAW